MELFRIEKRAFKTSSFKKYWPNCSEFNFIVFFLIKNFTFIETEFRSDGPFLGKIFFVNFFLHFHLKYAKYNEHLKHYCISYPIAL